MTMSATETSSPEQACVMRADARRNHERLLAAAAAVFTEHGADDASLEEIARRAGVGIGTLYRHFPTRQALLEAVYKDQAEALHARALELLDSPSPTEALVTWLRAMIEFGATKRSLSKSLMATLGKDSELVSTCSTLIREAATPLLTRAQQAGEVRADTDTTDLLRLSHAIAVACEHASPHADQADRLLSLMFDGLRSSRPGSPTPDRLGGKSGA
jgi:AcrR family transcriptional regulator